MTTTDTLTYNGHITIIKCWCSLRVGVPHELYGQWAEHGKSLYCPLGHQFVIAGRTEAEELRESLEWERDNNKFWRDQTTKTERRLAAQKGQATKLRKRIAAGVCPCCSRSFVNLARHMSGQHPNYAEAKP